MSYEKLYLCIFYFDETDPNEITGMNWKSNWVKCWFLREEEEEKSVVFLEDPQWSFQVECQGTMPLECFEKNEETN